MSASVAANIICEKCGDPILSGKEIRLNGKYYHKQCLTCDYCGKQIDAVGEGVIVQGSNYYHADCFHRHVRKRCYVCGEWIEGSYFTDVWGNSYHKKHEDEEDHPRCEYCGRFITQEVTRGGIYYADGRIICHLCLPSAIADQDSARTILEEVRDTLHVIGIDVDISNVSIRLLGKDSMTKRFGGHMGNPDGVSLTDRDPVSGDEVCKIYLLYGMPRIHFIKVVAHELMHVWLWRNQDKEISSKYENNKVLIEGSCNLAAYLVLQHYQGDEVSAALRMIEENRNVHYGSGFREGKQYFDTHDANQWLDYIKTHPRYPAISSN